MGETKLINGKKNDVIVYERNKFEICQSNFTFFLTIINFSASKYSNEKTIRQLNIPSPLRDLKNY